VQVAHFALEGLANRLRALLERDALGGCALSLLRRARRFQFRRGERSRRGGAPLLRRRRVVALLRLRLDALAELRLAEPLRLEQTRAALLGETRDVRRRVRERLEGRAATNQRVLRRGELGLRRQTQSARGGVVVRTTRQVYAEARRRRERRRGGHGANDVVCVFLDDDFFHVGGLVVRAPRTSYFSLQRRTRRRRSVRGVRRPLCSGNGRLFSTRGPRAARARRGRLMTQQTHSAGVGFERATQPSFAPKQRLRGANFFHRPRARGEHRDERVVPELHLSRPLGVAQRRAGAGDARHERRRYSRVDSGLGGFVGRFLRRGVPDERVDEF
jgi:hypothetical protein